MATSQQLQLCKKITLELMGYPLANWFNTPVDQDAVPDYNKYVKHPQDLGSILDRLENEKYRNSTEWEKDMNYIWRNAVTYSNAYYGQPTYFSNAALELERVFIKLKRKYLDSSTPSGWINLVFRTQEKIDELLLNQPSTINRIFPLLTYDKLNDHELNMLVELSRDIQDESNRKDIANILSEDPSVQLSTDSLLVDVDSLNPETQHKLLAYYSSLDK